MFYNPFLLTWFSRFSWFSQNALDMVSKRRGRTHDRGARGAKGVSFYAYNWVEPRSVARCACRRHNCREWAFTELVPLASLYRVVHVKEVFYMDMSL